MEFKLRGAREGDVALLFQINRDAYKSYVEQIWGWDDEYQSEYFRKNMVLENIRIIEFGEEIVGFISIDMREDLIFMQSIAILADHRSKGIGATVIKTTIDRSDELQLPVHLQVMKKNPRARELYERMGFKVYGENETHYKLKRMPDLKRRASF